MADRPCRPRVAITMGDPAGVGPEVALRAATARPVLSEAEPVLVGDEAVWNATAERLGIARRFRIWGRETRAATRAPAVCPVAGHGGTFHVPGRPTRSGGRLAVAAILEAVRLVRSGAADAIVTAPIAKACLAAARFDVPGQTELLARLTRTPLVRMMMAGPRLRIVLVTTHLPLTRVPEAITRRTVLATITLADRELRDRFGVARPRLAVAGLNPHAGEGGMFGTEDRRAIAPAIRRAQREGIDARGPLPADGCIPRAYEGDYDAVVCMYHDQGLPAFKLVHFHDGVNVTLGLPLVRTSPDHGTAYDIAGRGCADPRSMVAAIRLAARLAAGMGPQTAPGRRPAENDPGSRNTARAGTGGGGA